LSLADHELKTWPEPFVATWDGDKPFELRKDDRPGGFLEGQRLLLREWIPAEFRYTGRAILARITYVLRGPKFGLPVGLVVLGLRVLARLSGVPLPRKAATA